MGTLLKRLGENDSVKEFIRFLVVGGGCFLLEYVLLYTLTEYIGWNYLVSAAVAFTISLIVNYILCVVVVFRVGNQTRKEFTLFIITSIAGLFINQLTMWFFVEIISLWYMFAKLIASGIVMIWNYVTKKYILRAHK